MEIRTVQDYEGLVRRVEGVAARSPLGYRVRLVLLTGLGFAVPIVALLFALGLIALIVAAAILMKSIVLIKLIQFAAIPLGLVFVIVRALLIRVPPPDGVAIDASDAPALFEAIERVRGVGDSKPVHEVKLIDTVNAAVMERPAWGLIGPSRRTLLLGVPLMAACTPAEFDAVLAHEFGHLARNHTRLANWIYRLRSSWSTILQRIEQDEHIATRALRAFYRRFSPYYSAYSFVLAQANEYEADDNAARATSARTAADALIRVSLQAERYSDYWRRLHGGADALPDAPDDAVPGVYTMLAAPMDPERAEKTLGAALARETSLADTHPSLSDRLRNLDAAARLTDPLETTAAATYLGPLFERFVRDESREWLETVRDQWRQRHEQSAGLRPRAEELREKDRTATLTTDETFELASLLERFESAAAALPLYHRMVEDDVSNVGARFHWGRILLQHGDPAGVAALEQVVESKTDASVPAASLLFDFHMARNETAAAARNETVLQAARDDDERLERERGNVTKKDRLEPHGLDDDALEAWRTAVAGVALVKGCRIARKPIPGRPEEYLHVVCVKLRMHFDVGGKTVRVMQQLLELLSADGMPPTCWLIVCPAGGENTWLWRKLGRVAGSKLLPRPRR